MGRLRRGSCRQRSFIRCGCGATGRRCKAQREPVLASCLRTSSRALLWWPAAEARRLRFSGLPPPLGELCLEQAKGAVGPGTDQLAAAL